MACTADSPCPSECAPPARPVARASAHLRPRRTTCAQFPPLWGNRLTSEISQNEKAAKEDRSLIPRRGRQAIRRATTLLPKSLRYRRLQRIVNERLTKIFGNRDILADSGSSMIAGIFYPAATRYAL